MTETTELLEAPKSGASRNRAGGLSGMVLTELKALAGELGLKGTSGMRKGDLVAAISARQNGTNGGHQPPPATGSAASSALVESAPQHNGHRQNGQPQDRDPERDQAGGPSSAPRDRTDGSAAAAAGGAESDSTSTPAGSGRPADSQPAGGHQSGEGEGTATSRNRRNRRNRNRTRDGVDGDGPTAGATQGSSQPPANQGGQSSSGQQSRQQEGQQNRQQDNQQNRQQDNQQSRQQGGQPDDGDGDGSRRSRRYRDRNRRTRDRFATETPTDTEIRDDDVLLPVAGILDVLDSYAFVRTSGYLTGNNDVYVSLAQVRRYGLRRGDAVTGMVRAPRDGEQARQKFNALVRLDSVNGLDPEQAKNRPEFTKLTPLYPNERLRLETESHLLTTRVIDLVMPVGKGQRALIVSPPKAGKTTVLQAIANAIAKNNPEVHLMVVLVDERPEEVTDMQRSVKGEVIASTFDRPPGDHTQLAELAIERAKRLVELGRDVVVLLDNITRLGRAYNLAAPASGRILSGGVDSTALFPPKRFLGAARNIENGGSLTIFASALVETGSAGDTVIFEEFKGTGNAELKLDRRLADKRIFPAIDIDQSGTRKENLLMSPDEYAVMLKLRRVLGALEAQQSIDLVLDRLRKTRNNTEFLMQVAATTPGADRD